MTRIALIAGEASGDALGAGLMRAVAERAPGTRFTGVAGPRMAAAGCEVLEPCERLAVMGLTEVLGHLPRLLRLRRDLARRLIEMRPDCVVGIDAPDFNLGLEATLKDAGIPVVHYVSPSVWAWRPGRVRKVARACHRVLCLFPFEPDYYRFSDVEAVYVGHPLADEIPLDTDRSAARRALELPANGPVVALLPGSRGAELKRLGGALAGAAGLIVERLPDAAFVAPMAGEPLARQFGEALRREGLGERSLLLDGRAREALAAADVALVASGTATLEAMLLRCPVVVAYRVTPLTHFMLRRLGLLRIRRYALPNILAARPLVPELMQGQANPEALAAAALAWLEDSERVASYRRVCAELHERLRCNADARAAEAVLSLVRRGTA